MLDFLDRIDHQVKLRGFRIELTEIEVALAKIPGIADAAVVLSKNLSGGSGLVSYVVPEQGVSLTGSSLREHLKGTLPDYMVPARFVLLEALPLTPNGKIDRRALSSQEVSAVEPASDASVPRTPTEELLAGLFAELLEIEQVGVAGDFFELGGHSLLATQLLSRVRAAFRVELPLRSLFEQPTVGGLAQEIDRALTMGGVEAPPMVRVDRGGDLPLSFAQQRLWFLYQLDSESPAYNVSLSPLLQGRLEVAALRFALSAVVERHEALRTRFPVVDGRPVQVIEPAARQMLGVVDLRGLSAEARTLEVQRLGAQETRRPFDLAGGPLLARNSVAARRGRLGEPVRYASHRERWLVNRVVGG